MNYFGVCCSFTVLFLYASTHLSSLTFCVESLQSIMTVLSQVESGGEVGVNPTAAAASATSASGINPVSRDSYCCSFFFYLTFTVMHLQALKSQFTKEKIFPFGCCTQSCQLGNVFVQKCVLLGDVMHLKLKVKSILCVREMAWSFLVEFQTFTEHHNYISQEAHGFTMGKKLDSFLPRQFFSPLLLHSLPHFNFIPSLCFGLCSS